MCRRTWSFWGESDALLAVPPATTTVRVRNLCELQDPNVFYVLRRYVYFLHA